MNGSVYETEQIKGKHSNDFNLNCYDLLSRCFLQGYEEGDNEPVFDYSGNSIPPPFVSANRKLRVVFTSDHSVQFNGFRAIITGEF